MHYELAKKEKIPIVLRDGQGQNQAVIPIKEVEK